MSRARPSPRERDRSAPDGVAGLAVRRAAAAAIAEVLAGGATLDQALARASGTPEAAPLAPRDEALGRAVAVVAFRHLGTIRRALAERLAKGLPRRASGLESILIAAAAQILFLDVPPYAAVNAAVALAKAEPDAAPFAGLVNAVLRRIAAEREAILGAPEALMVDTPAWLRERLLAHYGEAAAQAIALGHGREPGLDLTVKTDPQGWARRLDGVVLPTGSVRLRSRAPVASLPGYAEGAWWVQDAAAALPARLLAVMPGERVLDLCAAPGGKTAQLALAGGRVLAIDRSAARLEILSANMARLGLPVESRAADALALDEPPFDKVLVDAPCSATGTIRRHPDVAWRKGPADLAGLAALQARLLDKAAALTRPGGHLVYCTCSLEPEEGERQIDDLLRRDPRLRRLPLEPGEIGAPAGAVTAAGDLRTLPSMLANEDSRLAGLDGFFAARLVRIG